MVEMVEFHQALWLVMLESAKDRHVPPRVQYGTTYLLIRDDMRSVSCSDEWEVAWSFAQAHMVQEGTWYRDYPRKP
jgi:hypothetical protein